MNKFDSSFQFIGLLDLKGNLLETNQTSLDFIKANLNDVIGKPFWKTPWWSNSKETQAKLKKAIDKAKKGESVRFEVEHQNLNGQKIIFDFSLAPVKDETGKITQLIPEVRDITESKKLESLKKEFLSMAAHELKTPITTLKLISQAHIARYKRYGSDEIKLEELELIDRELERLTRLINDILDDTRIESGKLSLQLEQTNLNELLKDITRKMNLLSKHKIILHNPLEKISLIIDKHRIEQVLINLISNAIKYSPPGSEIEVGAKLEQGKALVWVTDHGIGIPKSQQQLIFDRFYQVKTNNSRGFGLGLYITKEVIKLHKGKIWVESLEGQGSTFFFSLP